MDDIYLYYVHLPHNVSEMVTPCYDGYTVYIDENLSDNNKYKAYCHALKHIVNRDFDNVDAQSIEMEAHYGNI